MTRHALMVPLLVCSMFAASAASAQDSLAPDRGKLLLTGGFSDVEGAGGGGLASWALISGYGSANSWGANAHYTRVAVDDFQLDAYGLAVGLFDRVELSVTRQDFEVTGTALDGVKVSQDIVGAKVRVLGQAVYDQNTLLPQVSLGVQYKSHRGIDNAGPLQSVTQLGARDENGTDYLIAATKLMLSQSLLVNATLRFTEANQFGLLGFGGDANDGYEAQLEATVAYLLRQNLAIGAEYRSRPDNLANDNEKDAFDAFIAWAPNKHVSLLGAWVSLGEILGPVTGDTGNQQGAYLSVQLGF